MTSGVRDLLAQIDGEVILPQDERYDQARATWNLAYVHLPELVVEARSVEDVVAAVGYARQAGLTVAIQATGHGVTVPAHESLLLVTSGLDSLSVDPAEGTATVGAGLTWAPILAAAQRHGLAPLVGSSPGVGAVGYTLGGGFGWLGRRYGLARDRVLSYTVVTASGGVVRATESEHSDLFAALRAGGPGSLGVVVEMEIGLVPVDTVYAGNLFYPIEMAGDVFDFYAEWSQDLPLEMTSAFNITSFPPLEVVPERIRGQVFAIVRGCHCGDLDKAAILMDRWRDWHPPTVDMFGPMPFSEMAAISQDPIDPVPALSSGRWITGLDSTVFEAMKEVVTGGTGPSPILFAETRHAGGAISENGPPAERALQVVGLVNDDHARAEALARVERMWDQLDSRIPQNGVYLNFTEGDERRRLTRSGFDDSRWDLVTRVKREVDPKNLFAHGLDL